MKLSRQYFVERDGGSSKSKVISKWNSFHGNTIGALSMTGITGRKKIYDPLLLHFPKIPQFYHYRNQWRCETVIGSAGPGLHPAPIYFEMVRQICTKYDVLWIDDEVIAGCGRTGKKMSIEHYGDVVPESTI